ncbi:hypothetical protein EYF80_058566 [Liparis tanakae]|uniref:Uncharacterized protein n=1 Tax=Liparis tanakae TaxID=230148 RepID=A0A4Z2ESM6_9TELE|nr:hypothetical protein EYF80_058566 [Liparis tanakae]
MEQVREGEKREQRGEVVRTMIKEMEDEMKECNDTVNATIQQLERQIDDSHKELYGNQAEHTTAIWGSETTLCSPTLGESKTTFFPTKTSHNSGVLGVWSNRSYPKQRSQEP